MCGHRCDVPNERQTTVQQNFGSGLGLRSVLDLEIVIFVAQLTIDPIIYGKATARVHSGHLNENGAAPGGCQLLTTS